jgi:hypothetical protein
MPEQDKLVQNRCYPGQTHAEEEGRTNGTKFRVLKHWQERNHYCGNSQDSYEPHVKVTEKRIAHEGVVHRRAKGGRNKGCNSGIVKPKQDV